MDCKVDCRSMDNVSLATFDFTADNTVLSLEKLTIATPNYMTLLVESLDLDVAAGGSLLVMGPSGCGKTSLLRAIGGLWDSGQGTIRRPGPDEVMVRPLTLCSCTRSALASTFGRVRIFAAVTTWYPSSVCKPSRHNSS